MLINQTFRTNIASYGSAQLKAHKPKNVLLPETIKTGRRNFVGLVSNEFIGCYTYQSLVTGDEIQWVQITPKTCLPFRIIQRRVKCHKIIIDSPSTYSQALPSLMHITLRLL